MKSNSDYNKLYDILNRIEQCPGVYLGNKSFSKLYDFIEAYLLGLREITGENLPFESEFQSFVASYYKKEYEIQSPRWKTHRWSRMISFFTLNDEIAFDEFYKLLREFQKTHN